MELRERCIIIPAIKKNAVIPDQLVKKMAGITLIQRALDTAKKIVKPEDVYVVTDSQEISLICDRNGVQTYYRKDIKLESADLIEELRFIIQEKSKQYRTIIISNANTPLVSCRDIQDAYDEFVLDDADILVTLKEENHRLWKKTKGSIDSLIFDDEKDRIYIETKSFLILRSSAIHAQDAFHRVSSFYLNGKAVEISGYQDWWICEKLLGRKRIVFVVAGYPAIGMGHISRALMLAHEITDHEVLFLCTRESELAIKSIAERDYETKLQTGPLIDEVLSLSPDMVVNDILDTEKEYIKTLKSHGIKVVNFEDDGEGSRYADLTINALYENDFRKPKKCLYGHEYFCLRDEFKESKKRRFRKDIKSLLITFGGTDYNNFTMQTLDAVLDMCITRGISISIVTGPGYLYKEELNLRLESIGYQNIRYVWKTGIMSSIMEQSDIAICSAGRTVYELAYMRIPAVVMSHHKREDKHTFARPENGFEYIGIMSDFKTHKVRNGLLKLLDEDHRRTLYTRMKDFHFERNKNRVIRTILSLLSEEA